MGPERSVAESKDLVFLRASEPAAEILSKAQRSRRIWCFCGRPIPQPKSWASCNRPRTVRLP